MAANPEDADIPTRDLLADEDALVARLKGWFQDDRDHHNEWVKEAKEDFAFVAGDQWDEDDKKTLEAEDRPDSSFNLVAPMIDSVTGMEVSNRYEVRFIPRKMGSIGINEMLTGADMWFRDQCNAEDEQSDAFRDTTICGRGVTDTRIDYTEDKDGKFINERVDMFEVFPDCNARKPNYADAKRIWRVRSMPESDAAELFPEADPTILNAGWAGDEHDGEPVHVYPGRDYDGDDSDIKGTRNCTVVECQWWELEPFYRFVDGATGEEMEMPQADFETAMERLSQMPPEVLYQMGIAPPQNAVPQSKRVYRRAFLGKELLEDVQPTPVEGQFTYKFITGKRDQNKGQFYGLVRPMKDPQRWTNKFASQIMHILNTNSKGGLLAERGAFEDDRKAETDWAAANSIVWVNKGALSSQQGAKVIPKPATPFPQGQAEMLQFAMGAMQRVTGLNMELLGMKDAAQAGVLEAQRKQAGITILASLFDSLKRYRKDQARLELGFIQQYLSDDRLVKIIEKEQQQYLPLNRESTLGEYEIVVDDAPSAPNMKERNWQVIMSLLPTLGPMMTPQIAAMLLQFSPLPENAVNKINEFVNKPPAPPTPEQLEAQEVAKAGAVAKVDETASKAEKNRADAMARQAATIQTTAELFLGMVNPDLPMAPIPSGPVPLLNIPPGAMQMPGQPPRPPMPPPPGMPPGGPPQPGPRPMPAMPDMAGRSNLPPPQGMPNEPVMPGQHIIGRGP